MQPPLPASDDHRTIGHFDMPLPVRQQILGLFAAKWTLGALRAAVELGVPDALAGGPLQVTGISAAVGADADRLYRLLRAVAAAGVLDERDDGVFALNAASEGLVTDAEHGIRDMFLFASDPMLWRPYENVAHTARTGQAAFDHAFGMSFYEYTRTHPASGALFDRAMRQNHYPMIEQILNAFDFGRFGRIADVGGGKGQFLAEILRRHPATTGVLADQAHTMTDAKKTLEEAGVAERVVLVPTDFFTEVPSECDAYFIKHTLHNWDDEPACRILTRIREAIGEDHDARLLIVDQLLAGPGVWDVGKLIDIEAMAVLGGRERSLAEWNRIAAAAGFELVGEPAPGALALLEYRPVHGADDA
jgi:SAM-dependent methyltransferase